MEKKENNEIITIIYLSSVIYVCISITCEFANFFLKYVNYVLEFLLGNIHWLCCCCCCLSCSQIYTYLLQPKQIDGICRGKLNRKSGKTMTLTIFRHRCRQINALYMCERMCVYWYVQKMTCLHYLTIHSFRKLSFPLGKNRKKFRKYMDIFILNFFLEFFILKKK